MQNPTGNAGNSDPSVLSRAPHCWGQKCPSAPSQCASCSVGSPALSREGLAQPSGGSAVLGFPPWVVALHV